MDLTTLRTFIETDLADTPLTAILAAAEEDLTLAVGPDTSGVFKMDMEGQEFLLLPRVAASITSITEYLDGSTTTLAVNDYELQPNKTDLRRLNTGTNQADGWVGTITVTFAPGDLKRRDRALVQLVELDLAFRPGARSESIGDLSRGMQDYDAERARIISGARTRSFA